MQVKYSSTLLAFSYLSSQKNLTLPCNLNKLLYILLRCFILYAMEMPHPVQSLSVSEARESLGLMALTLSEAEIQEMILLLEALARLRIDKYLSSELDFDRMA